MGGGKLRVFLLCHLSHINVSMFMFVLSNDTWKLLYEMIPESFQAAITEYHRLGGLKMTKMFLTVLEARKSKIKAPTDLVSGED